MRLNRGGDGDQTVAVVLGEETSESDALQPEGPERVLSSPVNRDRDAITSLDRGAVDHGLSSFTSNESKTTTSVDLERDVSVARKNTFEKPQSIAVLCTLHSPC